MIVLVRTYHEDRTTGILYGHHRWRKETLELPWKGNEPRVSCISEGTYNLVPDYAGRHRWFRILDPPEGRSAIEMHVATRPEHLKGCIGVAEEGILHQLVGMLPQGDTLWITSETGEPG